MNINLIAAVFTAFVTGALVVANLWLAPLTGIFCVLNAVIVHKMLVDKRG